MLNLSTQKAKTNNGPSKTCFYEEPLTSMEPFYCIKRFIMVDYIRYYGKNVLQIIKKCSDML